LSGPINFVIQTNVIKYIIFSVLRGGTSDKANG
jgi:hypothetical protein